jgi:poly-gamma-glutamate synthesis protein (capsule biosynthesis protein)
MRGVDVIVGNLEGVISTSSTCRTDKEVVLRFKPDIAELLNKYNFSGVNLANNHSNDCLEQGLADTKKILEANNMFYLGSELQDGYKVLTVGSERIALIGINEVTPWEDDEEKTLSQIKELSKQYDSVVVHIHWGREYDSVPTNEQRALAHRLVDVGAQIIIGHHPHMMQSIESYKGKAIFYSLGNFIFDQTFSGTTEGFAVGLIHKQGVTGGVQEIDRDAECGFLVR